MPVSLLGLSDTHQAPMDTLVHYLRLSFGYPRYHRRSLKIENVLGGEVLE